MAEKRAVRSQKYQAVFNEVIVPGELMEAFGNGDSIENRLNPWCYDEKLLDLEDQLKKEFWRVVETALTDRQKEVLKMMSDGYTQMEIAKILGLSQSTVQKNFAGSQAAPGVQKFLGGSKKRLNAAIDQDKKIIELLEKIRELREERW